MTTRVVLWILAVLWLIGGAVGDLKATGAIQQILAQIDYVVAAVFATGAEIVWAIVASRAPQPALPTAAPKPPGDHDAVY